MVSPSSGHSREEWSTSESDFGSFVTVDDHPLGLLNPPLTPPPKSGDGFKAFRDDAVQRAECNERRILQEMQAHDRDPLSWIQASRDRDEESDKTSFKTKEPSLFSTTFNDMQSLTANPNDTHTTESHAHAQDPTQMDMDAVSHIASAIETFKLAEKQPSSATNPIGEDLLNDLDPLSQPGSYTPRPRPISIEQPPIRPNNDILEELKQHEKNPRSWLKSTRQQGEDDLPSLLREASSTSIAKAEPVQTSLDASSSISRSNIPRITSDTHLLRNQRATSPPRPTPSSSSFAASRSWMSSLGLLSASRPAPTSPSASSAHGSHEQLPDPGGTTGLSPTQSTLHSFFARGNPSSSSPSARLGGHARYATEGHRPIHAATMPLPTPQIEHSPFAAPSFIPPSGAPGFTGDRNWNTAGFEFDAKKSSEVIGKGVSLTGRNTFTTPVLDDSIANALRSHLPALSRLPSTWTLLYSADQHGLSLNTLYSNCAPATIVGGGGVMHGSSGSSGTILAVQDADDCVFGAWIAEGMHLSHGSYYGGGDSFLWKSEKGVEGNAKVKVFKWTGKNDYVALCDTDGFSFGGGDGYYGLYIDSSLVSGTTHPCPTFDNVCLASGEKKGKMVSFDAVGLEVWGIGP